MVTNLLNSDNKSEYLGFSKHSTPTGMGLACVIFAALGTTWCTQKKAAPNADAVPNVPALPTPPTGNNGSSGAPEGKTSPTSVPDGPNDAQPNPEPAPPIPPAPAPTVTLNGGIPLTRNAQVIVTVTPAPGAETPRFMYITHTEGCSAHGAWQPYSPQTTWTLSQLNSTARVFVKIQNENRGESSCVSAQIIHDNTQPAALSGLSLAPPLTSPAQTATPTIRVSGVENDASVTLYRNISCTTAVGMAVASSSTSIDVTLTTPLAEGSHTLYANQTDAAGNVSPCSTANVTYTRDVTAPDSPILSIASGASYTNTASVPLFLSASASPAEMYVTNTAGCVGGGTWESYATSKSWTLGQSNTTATVYAKFRDAAGNETACISDTIVHDNTAPSSPSLALLSPATSPSQVTTPQFTAAQLETNATVNFYADASCSLALTSVQNVQTNSVTLSSPTLSVGLHTFSADQEDLAGNKSACSPSLGYTVLAPNQPPVLAAAGPFNVQTMAPAGFSLVAQDPDAQDTLSYSCAANCPTGLSVAGNQVIWTPHAEQGGTFNVLFKVTDNHGSFDQKTVTFNVTDVTPPNPPQIETATNASAQDNRNIKVTGQADLSSTVTVKLFRSEACLGQPISQVSATVWTTSGASVSLGMWDIKSLFSAHAQDAAGNTSACSPGYTHVRVPQAIKTQTSTDASSSPSSFVTLNNLVFFVADNGIHGNELWRTDGTANGTWMVKDIEANGAGTPAELVTFQGAVYFTHNDGTTGTELWKSDGTTEGTVLVKDIVPGLSSSSPTLFKQAGQRLFFRATTTAQGAELWSTDGTESGTQLVKDIRSGTGTSTPTALFNWNGLLLFQANDGTNGAELWKSDGTAAGTVMISNIRSGSSSSSPTGFTAAGAFVYFSASDATTSTELYRTDGTAAGTLLVLDIYAGTSSSSPTLLGAVGNNVLLAATTANEGRELWISDGTAQGTTLVTDLAPGTASASPAFLGTLAGNTGLLLSMTTSTTGAELWKSDGTISGTVIVKDIAAGTGSSSPVYLSSPADNAVVYFTANNGSQGVELWRTDGTNSGTQLVKDINPGSGSSGATMGSYLGNTGRLLFRADNGQNGTELWISDGTPAGTNLLKNIRLPGTSLPSAAANFDNVIYYSGNDGINGIELWKSDGTESGTILLKNINTGAAHSNPGNFTRSGGIIYFTATSAAEGTELWKTDGTTTGTVLVKDIRAGSNGSSPTQLIDVNGTLYFVANNSTNGTELWKSNGTAAGTVMVSDLVSGSGSSNILWLRALGNQVLFSASVSTTGQELWISDGTASGTQLLYDINPGTGSSTPSNAVVAGSQLYFNANNGTNGSELWVTNGTAQGTQMVKDLYAGVSSSSPFGFSDLGNGNVVFFATDAATGTELWRTDGTSAGTVQVKDIRAGSTGSSCYTMPSMAVTLNKAYFCANDGTTGTELWVTDGTAQGTQRVVDMSPGALGGLAANAAVLPIATQGRVFFVANEGGSSGYDLYLFDSTSSTPETMRIWNSPHQYWANPMIQIVGGSEIFFWGFWGNNLPTLLRQ